MAIVKKNAVLWLVFLGVAVPVCFLFFRWRDASYRERCLQNLRMIDASMECLAIEKGIHENEPFPIKTLAELVRPFVKDSRILSPISGLPRCPTGAEYIIPLAGDPAVCPYHGNLLLKAGGLGILRR